MTMPRRRLCPCGCGRPIRERSKFASEDCRNRMYLEAKKIYNARLKAGLVTPQKRTREARSVTIYYPDVALPDKMTAKEYAEYKYQLPAGTRVLIDGKVVA